MISSCFSILLWIKFLYFARGFKKFGPFVNITIKMLKSTLNFLIITSSIYLGFSHALFLLLGPYSNGYETIPKCLISVFVIMLGDFDLSILYKSEYPILATILFLIYSTIMIIIILNFLIAILSDIYSTMIESSDKKWLLEKAHLIIALQKSSCTSSCCKKKLHTVNEFNYLWIISKDDSSKSIDKLPFYTINER